MCRMEIIDSRAVWNEIFAIISSSRVNIFYLSLSLSAQWSALSY